MISHAAAEGVVAIARHLDQLASDQLEDLARCVVAAVQPAEMAGIVERDALVERLLHLETTGREEIRKDA